MSVQKKSFFFFLIGPPSQFLHFNSGVFLMYHGWWHYLTVQKDSIQRNDLSQNIIPIRAVNHVLI